MRRIRPFMIAMLLLTSTAAFAQRVEGDVARAQGEYATEVQVNGQGEAERNGAFARGLAQVLAKLTGDRAAGSRPGVGQELRRAREFVDGYDYRQDEGLSAATGAPTFKTSLVVRYDEDKVNELIELLGLPMWPQPRPKPVLWLAIDDGKGARLVSLSQVNAARSALDRAVERGYKLGLPGGNAAEQAAVGAIWRGDSAAVARLSQRYSPPMQLVGKVYRDAAGWMGEWIFVDSGKVLSSWKTNNPDARKVMAGGADGAADALMKRYSKRGTGAGPAGTYAVLFNGLHSSEDYIRLSGALQRISVVRRITPVRATAEGVTFNLDLVSGLPGLKRMAGDSLSCGDGEPTVCSLR